MQDGVRTAGILLREGVSRGLAPAVEVLSIGSTTGSRQSDDILPYLPKFRNRFGGLPTIAEEMKLKAMSIPLSDIECITKTTVKVKGPM